MSLGWFFQLPGLFITGGVLLILIALAVFIIGSKGGINKEVKTDELDSEPVKETEVPASEPVSEIKSDENTTVDVATPLSGINSFPNIEPVKEEPVSSEVSTSEVVTPQVKINPVTPEVPTPEVVMPQVEINPTTPVEISPTQVDSGASTPSNVEEI